MITDPGEVAEEVGGQHHRYVRRDRAVQQVLQELSPGKRVESSQRLVQQQHLRSLRDGQRECYLGALPARQLSSATVRGTSARASRARAMSSSQLGFIARPKCSMSATLNSLYSGQS